MTDISIDGNLVALRFGLRLMNLMSGGEDPDQDEKTRTPEEYEKYLMALGDYMHIASDNLRSYDEEKAKYIRDQADVIRGWLK